MVARICDSYLADRRVPLACWPMRCGCTGNLCAVAMDPSSPSPCLGSLSVLPNNSSIATTVQHDNSKDYDFVSFLPLLGCLWPAPESLLQNQRFIVWACLSNSHVEHRTGRDNGKHLSTSPPQTQATKSEHGLEACEACDYKQPCLYAVSVFVLCRYRGPGQDYRPDAPSPTAASLKKQGLKAFSCRVPVKPAPFVLVAKASSLLTRI